MEIQPHRLSVQVAVEAQQIRLHRHGVPVGDGGPCPHVGHAGAAPPVRQKRPCDVYAPGRRQHMGRHGQVHRGDADGAAQPLAVLHRLTQAVGMAQKQRRPLHVALLHQRADIGGADGDALDLHLGDDIAAQPQVRALRLQQRHRALVFVAEAVVVAGHEMHRAVVPNEHLNVILPAHGHHGLIEAGEDDPLNAVYPSDDVPPVVVGVEQRHRRPGDKFSG